MYATTSLRSWSESRDFHSGIAVPGDIVTVWTRRAGSTASWVQAGSTRADASKAWTFPLTVTHDIDWRVSSPSGTSAARRTVVVPSIHAPTTSTSGAPIVLRGRAIPGQSLTLYRAYPGSTTWTAVATVTVAADGSWRVTRHPTRTVKFRAMSHGQASRTVTVTIG